MSVPLLAWCLQSPTSEVGLPQEGCTLGWVASSSLRLPGSTAVCSWGLQSFPAHPKPLLMWLWWHEDRWYRRSRHSLHMAAAPFSWLVVTAVWLERSPLPGLKRAALYPPAGYSSCMVCATTDHVVVSDLVLLESGGITKRWTLVGRSLATEVHPERKLGDSGLFFLSLSSLGTLSKPSTYPHTACHMRKVWGFSQAKNHRASRHFGNCESKLTFSLFKLIF